ncbi:hypothetical protein WMY93_001244 [Mugilogobius chulae]|uniref:PDZ domain-containing protein n=1 Tax=Mugilogobius chulae TaxID=88201 RepID=A0AAW0Q1P3_9GOBI
MSGVSRVTEDADIGGLFLLLAVASGEGGSFIPGLLSQGRTKTGIYLMQEGNEEPFNIRLHLAKDILTIQEQDVICVSGEPFYSSERTVTIRRQTIGGFGLSIKGGAEHKIPVVISKISKEQKAELSGLLFIGDGILQINGINVRSYRHEEVVQVLRNAGEEVTLTVSFLKKTPAFLKLPSVKTARHAVLFVVAHVPGLRWEKRWVDLRLIPLLHSRLSQYMPGSDVCRKNAFQVIAVDGVCSGVIQFQTADDCLDWLQAIAGNISNLTKHNVTTWDWTRAEKSFTVYEIMCKILKDNDLVDKRRHCFSVQTETGEDLFFSVELECELLTWEKAFQMATFLEVERIQAVLWRYKFSQLKGSSDDGKSKIKFLFQNQDSKSIEAKELEFSNLFAVLHCIHAFFAAKVACLDPMFVESQANATTTGIASLSGISCNNAQPPKLKYNT